MPPGDNLWNEQSLTFSGWICEIGNKQLSKKREIKISCLSIWECSNTYVSFHNRPFLNVDDNISRRSSHHGHCKHTANKPQLLYVFQCTCLHNSCVCALIPLADMHTSLLMRCGSQRNSSRQSMVHCPTTGFLPNGLWSITFSTMGGVYISSLGRS